MGAADARAGERRGFGATGRFVFAAYRSHVGRMAVVYTAAGRIAQRWTIGKPAAALRMSRDGDRGTAMP